MREHTALMSSASRPRSIRQIGLSRRLRECFPMFDAETWSRMRGISVATARARLGQYRDRAQLFAIRDAGEDQYPRFQFDTEGLPLPDVAMILTRVPEPARGWPVLSWFATSNARLAGRKPHEVLMAPRLTRPAVGLAREGGHAGPAVRRRSFC